jgi:hypothetical protein
MHSYLQRQARRAVTLAALVLAGCIDTPGEALSITDPDIINPSDVQSAAGANAVRLGALSRLNLATTGVESLVQLGGLLADEWRSGDSFVDRDQTDRRVIIRENGFALTANRNLHRARLAATQAAELMLQFAPAAPAWQLAEMYFVQAYIETMLAEHYCNGMILSRVVNGVEVYGTVKTTAEVYTQALAHADSGLALITGTTTDDNRVRGALQVVRGRILLNQNLPSQAATAVASVLTTHRYNVFHASTTTENQIWALNNRDRRYNLSGGEGINGIDFVTPADPRVPSCVGATAPCVAAGATQPRTFDNNTVPQFRAQLIWTALGATVDIVNGIEARLIEAEAELRANPGTGGTYLAILNQLRTTVAGLTPLVDPGTDALRRDLIFRERAFWLFGRGHRLGDLRRLIRQYGLTEAQVFPTGAFHKGGNYGTDVNFPIPQAEDNNPNAVNGVCIDRDA